MSLEMYFKIYGKQANHPDIAENLTNLGIAYNNNGDYDMAI